MLLFPPIYTRNELTVFLRLASAEFCSEYPNCHVFNRKKEASSTQRSEIRLFPAGSPTTALGTLVFVCDGVHRSRVVARWLCTPVILSKRCLVEFTRSTSPSP